MRRRTFVTSGPVAALSSPLMAVTLAEGRAAEPASQRFNRTDVHGGDRVVGAPFASRTAVYGTSGAAASAHPLATQTGVEILKRGGSAVDAAIAMNACLGFLEPTSCGLGGDCFAMLWDPQRQQVVGLAGSGASPRKLTLETVRSRAVNGALPPIGAITVSTPGACDAW